MVLVETKADGENYLNNIFFRRKSNMHSSQKQWNYWNYKKIKTKYIPNAYFSILLVI